MRIPQFLLLSSLLLTLLACRREGTLQGEPQPASPSSEFALHRSMDSLVLVFCGEGDRLGVDSLGPRDTLGLFTHRFEKFVWDGRTDTLGTGYGSIPLRTLGLGCRERPWIQVAVVNPTRVDFRPLVFDTARTLDSALVAGLVDQARSLEPETSMDVEQGEVATDHGWYGNPPRILALRDAPDAATFLQFGCRADESRNCGPLFRLLRGRLQLLPGPISSKDLLAFTYSGRSYLVNYAGMPDCGNVWTDLIRLDRDSSRIVLRDGRFGD